MQVNTLDEVDLAALLEQSEILEMSDLSGVRMYVLEYERQGILVFAGPGNDAFVVYPPESFDQECGGSIHQHARANVGGGNDG